MTRPVEYVGKDLEAMSFARNYHAWILDVFRPYLGKHIVEVGAGTGSFSQMLLDTKPETLSLIEPSAMFDSLKTNLSTIGAGETVQFYNGIFSDVAEQIRKNSRPDSILYVNVLEHIEDDLAELVLVRDTLISKGRVLIFVPAMPILYGQFDKLIGHFRRYRKKGLKEKCEAAGLKVLKLQWFDMIGSFPWFIKYRLLRSVKMEPAAVGIYDRVVVPVARPLEKLVSPPFGKNLLLIAERD